MTSVATGPADLTPPLSPRPVVDFRQALENLRQEFLRRIEEVKSSFTAHFDEHEDRLDDHERRILSLTDGQREIKESVHKTQGDVNRIADAATVQSFAIERQQKVIADQAKQLAAQGKQLAEQGAALTMISETTQQTLAILQERITL